VRRHLRTSDPESALLLLLRRMVLNVVALTGAGERSTGAVQICVRRAGTPAESVAAEPVGHPAPTRTSTGTDWEREQRGRRRRCGVDDLIPNRQLRLRRCETLLLLELSKRRRWACRVKRCR